jgi:hypothetical protein
LPKLVIKLKLIKKTAVDVYQPASFVRWFKDVAYMAIIKRQPSLDEGFFMGGFLPYLPDPDTRQIG